MTIPSWTNDITMILDKNYITELYPSANMTFDRKINAISRLILLITILGYVITFSPRILIIGLSTLFIIYLFMKWKFATNNEEGFQSIDNNNKNKIINPETLEEVLSSDYQKGNKKNPFSNVLLTEIMDTPERKSAPPSFNLDVDEDITKNVKKSVQYMNPTIKNTNKQLYKDMWQQFLLDQSNRVFYSMPNTKVCNDQGAFGKFLYGDMPSAKESTAEGNLQREKDSYRYTLY
jgi:hypothetical protein